jgi:hypothetical protein
VGGKVALGAAQEPLGVPTVRGRQTIRVEMLFEPTLYMDAPHRENCASAVSASWVVGHGYCSPFGLSV